MKCNAVTFTASDGASVTLPLDFLIEKGAVVANKVNGEDLLSVMGAANQLWIPGLPAKYFVRDIVGIRFTQEEEIPVIASFVDDGRDFVNRPSIQGVWACRSCSKDGPTTTIAALRRCSSR